MVTAVPPSAAWLSDFWSPYVSEAVMLVRVVEVGAEEGVGVVQLVVEQWAVVAQSQQTDSYQSIAAEVHTNSS